MSPRAIFNISQTQCLTRFIQCAGIRTHCGVRGTNACVYRRKILRLYEKTNHFKPSRFQTRVVQTQNFASLQENKSFQTIAIPNARVYRRKNLRLYGESIIQTIAIPNARGVQTRNFASLRENKKERT